MIAGVHAILQHVPFLKGKALVITELGGGMTNRIYKIDDVNESFVLRVFGQGTELLGIDRDRELACSKAIADAGLGAEVMSYLPELNPKPFEEFCGALLLRFLPGKLLSEEQVQNVEMLRRIGVALRACHAIPVDDKVAEFNVFHTIRDYLDKARARKVQLPAAWDEALAMLSRIEAELGRDEPACLCHNDLLVGNFVDDGQTLRLIDWEYGGRGNRWFDLGNFAANLQLTPEQEVAFLQAYFGAATPADIRRLKLMRVASDLREASWGFLQEAVAKVEPPQKYGSFFKYGAAHLERALAAAKGIV
jgi:thiamine kinase-like enzyme